MGKMKTGIYSGSFNPIHIGHLALANWLCEFGGLDELWFMVTPHNPIKARAQLIDDRLRLEMVAAAIDDYPKFKVSDFEFQLPQPTYTIDTLRALANTYPEREFHLVMGSDNWQIINRWKEHERLLNDYHIIVYPRLGYPVGKISRSNIVAVNAPIIEISSTMIREACREGRDVRFLLPEKVRPYLFGPTRKIDLQPNLSK